MIRVILASAVAAVLWVGAASAATIITYSATPSDASATMITTPGVATPGSTFLENISTPGLIPSTSLSPWAGPGPAVYSSITGEVSYTFSGFSNFLSLVWGSPDTYNTLEFHDANGLVETVLGGTIRGIIPGNGNIANSLVNIATQFAFNKVVFKSTQAAFEYANLTNMAPVPLPAGGLLLLGGLGGLAALRRRKSV